MGSWLSGGLAALLSLIELQNARRKPPCLRACHWVIVRLAFDAGTAMLAYSALTAALSGLSWFTGPWPIVVAGLAGPALLRSQLALLGSGQESNTYGPANVYKRIQRSIDRTIDDIGSVTQSEWVTRKAVPAMRVLDLSEIRAQVTVYVKSVEDLAPRKRDERIAWIEATVLDSSTDHDQKIEAIVQYLIDNGGRRLVRTMVRRGRRISGISLWTRITGAGSGP